MQHLPAEPRCQAIETPRNKPDRMHRCVQLMRMEP